MTSVQSHPRVSKYIKLAELLRHEILAGRLQAGDQIPSFAEMCRTHDVSRATAERVCELLEQDGLIERRQGKGTFVCDLRQKRTGVIGLIGDGWQSQNSLYWVEILNGVREVAQTHGQQILFVDERRANWASGVDGVLVHNSLDVFAGKKHLMLPENLPSVSLLTKARDVPSVVADEFAGICSAIEHLAMLGHRRIAYLSVDHRPEAPNVAVQQRIQAYYHALEQLGIHPDPRWLRLCHWSNQAQDNRVFENQSQSYMAQWLREDWRELGCTALLVLNDEMAIGAMQALEDTGLQVPTDVSVVGFDSTNICELVKPRLTSVKVPLREIGRCGMELLQKTMEGKEALLDERSYIVLPTELEQRDSTREIRLKP